MIAALFVQKDGSYFGVPDLDPWDEARDARQYPGPHRVIAHPPCQRWGKYWHGGPSCKIKKKLGDDGGCFAAALAAVRIYGGVLEHPVGSAAWNHFMLNKPPASGGWIAADFYGGFTCQVEQGHYGHRARKATWLYAAKLPDLPVLKWGPSFKDSQPLCDPHPEKRSGKTTKSAESARRDLARGIIPVEWMDKSERAATPAEFRDLLISMVRPR